MNFPLPDFPTTYSDVLERVDAIRPKTYDQTRNYVKGAVSYLSPYFSRGVITLAQVKKQLYEKHPTRDCYRYIFELAWREYFQQVWWQEGDRIFENLRSSADTTTREGIPLAIAAASTQIEGIDAGIRCLYETGYQHNHLRMYVAALCTNIARVHWLEPARWMYYHLLDADPASNLLSWQWVAGSFSGKKYFFNQENLNRYTGSKQVKTFMDVPYEAFPLPEIPAVLQDLKAASALLTATHFPNTPPAFPEDDLPVFIYTPFHLDPVWRADEPAHRICWWPEPLMEQLPMCTRTLDFIHAFAAAIPGVLHTGGTLASLMAALRGRTVFTRRHALFREAGNFQLDEDHLLFPEIRQVSGSFMNYWKKCERLL